MKTNYINQLQRDIMKDCDHSDCTPIVKDVSITDKAEKYAYNKFGSSNEIQNERPDCQKHFIAGANEMLPIIKELGEALMYAKSFIPKKVYGQGESYNNEVYTYIETTLNKYKQYL